MRRYRLSAPVLVSVLAACAGGTPTPEAAPTPRADGTAAITPEDLRHRIAVFAHDSMGGRRTGTPGNARGNAYIAAELARLGLRPAGGEGTYFQPVPLSRHHVAPDEGTLRAGGEELVVFQDYFPYQTVFQVPARPLDGAQVIYIGGLADSTSLPPRDSLRGKVVVFRSAEGASAISPPDLTPQGRLGLIAGIMITGIDPLIATYREVLRTPQLSLASHLEVPPGVTQPRLIFLPTETVPRLFGRPLDQLRPGDRGPVLGGDVGFESAPVEAANVVAVLEGSDPALRGQYVALGAHSDAIGVVTPAVDHDSLRAYNTVIRPRGANDPPREPTPDEAARIRSILDSLRRLGPARPDSIVNGADDDGSGSMGLLEVAEALARADRRPRRSILFVWHTGEESGLQGSRWFTDNPTVPRDSIVAQINMDMIGRGGPSDESTRDPAYMQVIGSRRLSTELGDLVEAVNREGSHGFEFDYSYDADGHPDNFYCRSDHYMYARYGIPVTFFSTGGHRDYHQVTDEIQYLDFDKYARVTRFVADLTARLANQDRAPRVDQPKPDPNAPCKQ